MMRYTFIVRSFALGRMWDETVVVRAGNVHSAREAASVVSGRLIKARLITASY